MSEKRWPADFARVLLESGRYRASTDAELADGDRELKRIPTLASLRGIAPDLTGGLSSEAYVRRMRDA